MHVRRCKFNAKCFNYEVVYVLSYSNAYFSIFMVNYIINFVSFRIYTIINNTMSYCASEIFNKYNNPSYKPIFWFTNTNPYYTKLSIDI